MTERIPKRGKWVNPATAFVVHPDNSRARWKYADDKDAIKAMMEERKQQTEGGYKYWNDEHDIELSETAIENTHNAIISGKWRFPPPAKKRK